ncbi:MAG: DUF2336 domain-containing protein [Hyphomicrobiales bacterium]
MNEEANPGLDTGIFYEVIENRDVRERLTLARQLSELLADPEAPETEKNQTVPAVLKLIADPAAEVRMALAGHLVRAEELPADIIFNIIASEDEIALPFLAATPALNDWHMMAILRVGDPPRQVAVALRHDISAEAIEFAVKSARPAACLALFDNPAVKLDDRDYHTLYARFGQSPEVVERLLGRPDLPLDIRIMQAKRASNRMQQLMADRGWIPLNDAAELVADAEETAILRILVEADPEELARVVPFLVAKAMLTPSIVVRAACLGQMQVVERALAHLAGLPATRARELMRGRGLLGFKSLHAKSGLPQSCFGILRAACDVTIDEAEEGIELDPEAFGRRLIETLMTRYEAMPVKERARHLEFVGRFAEDRVRIIAQRLKADIVRAA